MTLERAKQRTEQVSGVSNVAYDLVTILENKLKGIAAFEEYQVDAQQAGDREVQELLDELARRECEDVDKVKRLVVQWLR